MTWQKTWLWVACASGLLGANAGVAHAGPVCGGEAAQVAGYGLDEGGGLLQTVSIGSDGALADATLQSGAFLQGDVPPAFLGCGSSLEVNQSPLAGARTTASYDPLGGAKAFTVMAWVKRLPTTQTAGRVLSDSDQLLGGAKGFQIRFSGSNGDISLQVNAVTATTNQAAAQIAPGSMVWSHVAVTYDSTLSSAHSKFYKDGVQVGGLTLQSGIVLANAVPLTLGNADASLSDRSLDGRLDDVRIFKDVVLTAAEIQCYMQAASDVDADGAGDACDNCPVDPNPAQADIDGNGTGNVCDTVCASIQRGVAGTLEDASIASGSLNFPFGSSSRGYTGDSPSGAGQLLVRFDLAFLPPGTKVSTASLTMSAVGAGTIDVHRVLAPWAEAAVTWGSFGGAYDPAAVGSFASGVGLVSADLTALAQEWVDGVAPNDGVLLGQAVGTTTRFRTSENVGVLDRPVVDLCYTLPDQ